MVSDDKSQRMLFFSLNSFSQQRQIPSDNFLFSHLFGMLRSHSHNRTANDVIHYNIESGSCYNPTEYKSNHKKTFTRTNKHFSYNAIQSMRHLTHIKWKKKHFAMRRH